MKVQTNLIIRRVLSGRELNLHHGTVGFNRAAEELEQIGVESINDIVSTLKEPELRSRSESGKLNGAEQSGLSNLLAVYWKLAVRAKRSDIGRILLSFEGPIREEALRMLLAIFGPGASAGIRRLPVSLIETLVELRKNGSPKERKLATRFLSSLVRQPAISAKRLRVMNGGIANSK